MCKIHLSKVGAILYYNCRISSETEESVKLASYVHAYIPRQKEDRLHQESASHRERWATKSQTDMILARLLHAAEYPLA